jgi:hypothetical protein
VEELEKGFRKAARTAALGRGRAHRPSWFARRFDWHNGTWRSAVRTIIPDAQFDRLTIGQIPIAQLNPDPSRSVG